ncbi:short-chain dehydrogenase [Phlyctema vagabunda]|uniref:Short-chain dehydrogenase n=1 Tax=Phlyctema vagabunda TaxID=108571 RepID=A0ABR4PH58_9HELO
MSALASLAWNNKFGLPALPPAGTFKDQSILITGASSGLGLAAAVHFVNLGASKVIITARTKSRGDAARQAIESQTGIKNVVELMELDMSTFEHTKSFADQVKAEVGSIDYVLLNAGLLNTKFKQTSDGWEETIQVNVLSTALLAILLLPWIKEAGKGHAHLGFVTSGLHRFVDIDRNFPTKDVLSYYSKKENYPKAPPRDPMYGISKLLEHYVVNEIAKIALGSDGSPQVIVNTICPGLVKSDLARQYKTSYLLTAGVNLFQAVLSKSTEGGARTLVLSGLTPASDHGKFIKHYSTDEEYNRQVEKNITGPKGQELQAKVWNEVLAILEGSIPEVKGIVARS